MSVLVALLVAVAVLFLVRAGLNWSRPRSAAKLVGTGIAVGLVAGVAADGRPSVGQRVVVLLTESHDPRPVLDRLTTAGAVEVAFVRLVPDARPTAGPLAWQLPSAPPPTGGPTAGTLDAAVQLALDGLADAPGDWLDRLLHRQRRLVVTVGDRERWGRWLPLDVRARLADARRGGVVVDLVEAAARPDTVTIEFESDLDLPAYVPLGGSGRRVRAVARGAALRAVAGGRVTLRLTVTVDGTSSELTDAAFPDLPVSADGAASCWVPVARLGPARTLVPHFAMLEASGSVQPAGGPAVPAGGTTWLPVRTPRVLVACGDGRSAEPLLGGRWDGDPVRVTAAAIEARLLPALLTPRGETARYEFAPMDAAARRVLDGGDLPDLLVLHSPSAADLARPGFAAKLVELVRGGLNLAVVDPPPLPTDAALTDTLKRLLPATASTRTTGDPAEVVTVDRSSAVLFAFDTNALWSTPGAPFPHGLEVQRAFAERCLEPLRAAGRVNGHFRIVEVVSGQAHTRRVAYQPDPARPDRVLVAVAPVVAADGGQGPAVPPDPTLANHLLPSLIDLRLAAAFSRLVPDDVLAAAGLRADDAPVGLEALLAARPAVLPNTMAVVFAGRAAGQPGPDPLNPGGPAPRYTLNHAGPVRALAASPAGMVPRLLGHGVHVVPVLLATDEPPGATSYETGLNQMVRVWPRQEANLFIRFTRRPADLFGGTATTLANLPAAGLTAARAADGLLAPLMLAVTGPAPPMASAAYDRVRAVLAPPAEAGMVEFPVAGRAIDERFLDPARLRPAPPRRSRVLAPNPAFGAFNSVAHAVEVTPPGMFPRTPQPDPLLVGGRLGAGHVVVFAYSPAEGPPNPAAWPNDELVLPPDPAHVDALGGSRLIDLGTFVGRTRPPSGGQPVPRRIRRPDARGGLEIEADFTSAGLRTPAALAPTLTAGGAGVPMTLDRFNPARGRLAYSVGPAALGRLFPAGRPDVQRTELDVGGGSRVSFPVRRPVAHEWGDLDALSSARTLAALSGGRWVPAADPMPTAAAAARLWALLLLGGALAVAGLVRWARRWAADRRLAEETAGLRELDAHALADALGQHAAERDAAVDAARPFTREAQFDGCGELEAILPADRIAYAARLPTRLLAVYRPLPRTAEAVVVLNLGRSMRLGVGRHEPKVRLAEVAAVIAAVVAARGGATVRLSVGGTAAGRWADEMPWDTAPGPGEVEEVVAEAVSRPAEPLPPTAELDVTAGATVYWVSDFHEEFADGGTGWGRWAAGVTADSGRVAAVHVSAAAEADLTGWVGSALAGGRLDRSAPTPTELGRALAANRDRVLETLAGLLVPAAALHGRMTADEIVAALADAELFT